MQCWCAAVWHITGHVYWRRNKNAQFLKMSDCVWCCFQSPSQPSTDLPSPCTRPSPWRMKGTPSSLHAPPSSNAKTSKLYHRAHEHICCLENGLTGQACREAKGGLCTRMQGGTSDGTDSPGLWLAVSAIFLWLRRVSMKWCLSNEKNQCWLKFMPSLRNIT